MTKKGLVTHLREVISALTRVGPVPVEKVLASISDDEMTVS